MDFGKKVRPTIKKVDPIEEMGSKCVFCNSANTIIRSSQIRRIPALGSTLEKVIVEIKRPRIKCNDCGEEFMPHHPLYPPKFEYSQAIVEYALTHYHYNNASSKKISRDLKLLHQVDVPEDTIYSWITTHSPAFIEKQLNNDPAADLSHVKSITIDGTHVSTGKDIIGKKKLVDSLSVPKLKNGDYLLMWWK